VTGHLTLDKVVKQADEMVSRSNRILRPVNVGDNVLVPIANVDRGRREFDNFIHGRTVTTQT